MKYCYRIDSLKNAHIKKLYKLKKHKYRVKFKKALIDGWRFFGELIANKKEIIFEILVLQSCLKKLRNFLSFKDCNLYTIIVVNLKIINKLSGIINNNEIITVINLDSYYNYNEDINLINNYLILENIQDPGNLGTLIRTSLGFNVKNILLINNCVDLFNSKTIRASQCSFIYLNVYIVDFNYTKIINKLKFGKYKIITTNLNNQNILLNKYKFKENDKFALCLGNEGRGITNKLSCLSDINIKISINPRLDSLNVAQAGSIILYEIDRQKNIKEEDIY